MIDIIAYECGKGAQIQECEHGPSYLKNLNLIKGNWITQEKSNFNIIDDIFYHCSFIKEKINTSIKYNNFPLVIGGDHSSAIGTWSGLKEKYKNLKLFWFDAHMDSHNFKSSISKAYHGMPISYLLGYGNDKISKLILNKFAPEDITLIGIRSYEAAEKEFLNSLNIKIIYMDDFKLEDLDILFNTKSPFGISIDLDGFDPKLAPGVGSPENKGFKEDLIEKLSSFSYQNLKALEIAEYNPNLDIDNKTAFLIKKICKAILKT